MPGNKRQRERGESESERERDESDLDLDPPVGMHPVLGRTTFLGNDKGLWQPGELRGEAGLIEGRVDLACAHKRLR